MPCLDIQWRTLRACHFKIEQALGPLALLFQVVELQLHRSVAVGPVCSVSQLEVHLLRSLERTCRTGCEWLTALGW